MKLKNSLFLLMSLCIQQLHLNQNLRRIEKTFLDCRQVTLKNCSQFYTFVINTFKHDTLKKTIATLFINYILILKFWI